MSQSNLGSTMQLHPPIDAEMLAGWDLAWDYTLGLDLTFLVFFECKHAHHFTCRGLTSLLKKKRVDLMLGDPSLPRLPLPAATSQCSLFSFSSMATFHSTNHPWRGNLHLWLSPEITLIISPAFLRKTFFSAMTWASLPEVINNDEDGVSQIKQRFTERWT